MQPHSLYSPWNSPGQNTGVGSLSILQGIFVTQGSNPGMISALTFTLALQKLAPRSAPPGLQSWGRTEVGKPIRAEGTQPALLALAAKGQPGLHPSLLTGSGPSPAVRLVAQNSLPPVPPALGHLLQPWCDAAKAGLCGSAGPAPVSRQGGGGALDLPRALMSTSPRRTEGPLFIIFHPHK